MKLDTIHQYCHHWTRIAMLCCIFMWTSWALRLSVKYDKSRTRNILINLRQGQLTLELFIKSAQNVRSSHCLSMGLRHLAFKVDDVETLSKAKWINRYWEYRPSPWWLWWQERWHFLLIRRIALGNTWVRKRGLPIRRTQSGRNCKKKDPRGQAKK